MAAQAGMVVQRNRAAQLRDAAVTMLGGEVTPTAQFYRRNNFPIPVLDGAAWRLGVRGLVDLPLQSEPARADPDARGDHGGHARMRRERAGEVPAAGPGEQWGFGAVSTAEWTGPRLAAFSGAPGSSRVLMRWCSAARIAARSTASRIPSTSSAASRWRRPGVRRPAGLRDERPAAARPARVPAPAGRAGLVRGRLGQVAQQHPGDGRAVRGFFQTQRYVYERDRDGTEAREPVRLQKVRALITRPGSGQALAGGALIVRGVAWSGAAPIERVEVSLNDGPWQKTRLVGVPAAHGWQQWEFLASGLSPGRRASAPGRRTWSARSSRSGRSGTAAATGPTSSTRSWCGCADEPAYARALTPPGRRRAGTCGAGRLREAGGPSGPPGRSRPSSGRWSLMSGSVASSRSGAQVPGLGRQRDCDAEDGAAARAGTRPRPRRRARPPARPRWPAPGRFPRTSSTWPGRPGRTARRRARPARAEPGAVVGDLDTTA